MNKLWIVISIFIFILFFPSFILAHPGRTAADGCHYCRTNCDSWGVTWDERHCHGGSVQGIQEQPIYSLPTNTPYIFPTNVFIPTKTPTPKPKITKKVKSKIKKIIKRKKTPTPTPMPKKKSFWQLLFSN